MAMDQPIGGLRCLVASSGDQLAGWELRQAVPLPVKGGATRGVAVHQMVGNQQRKEVNPTILSIFSAQVYSSGLAQHDTYTPHFGEV